MARFFRWVKIEWAEAKVAAWQQQLKASSTLFVAILCLFTSSSHVLASTRGNVSLGLTPYSSAPAGYPQAFNGIGFSMGAGIYFFGDSGLTMHFIRSGTASVFDLNYRLYILGEPQGPYIDTSILPSDRIKQPMNFRHRNWGLYGELGGSYFSVTKLEYSTGSKVEEGICMAGAVGFEYPIWKSFAASFKIGTYQTMTRTFQTVFAELSGSLAFDL